MGDEVSFPKYGVTNDMIMKACKSMKAGKAGTWDCIPDRLF